MKLSQVANLEYQLQAFGAKDAEELILKKTEKGKVQHRVGSPKRATFVQLTAEQCKRMCEAREFDYMTGFENRVLSYRITDETTDWFGDIVRAKGGDFKSTYPSNPVIQFSHDYGWFPVGNSIKEWYEGSSKSIHSWGLFVDERIDSSGFAVLTFKFAASGIMKACSIGFMPLEWNRPSDSEEREELGLGEYGIEFLKWVLLEYSPCPVPANPSALQDAIKELKDPKKSFAYFQKEDIDLIAKVKFMSDDVLDLFATYLKGEGKITKKSIVQFNFDFKDADFILPPPVTDKEKKKELRSLEDIKKDYPDNDFVEIPISKTDKPIEVISLFLAGHDQSKHVIATEETESSVIVVYEKIREEGEEEESVKCSKCDKELKIEGEDQITCECGEVYEPIQEGVTPITGEEYEKFCREYDVCCIEDITKDIALRPFPNEHACRLKDPDKYEKFRRGKRKSDGKEYSIIFGKLKDEDKWEEQAYRYKKTVWTEDEARKHCTDHDGILFEPAESDTKDQKELVALGKQFIASVNKFCNSMEKLESIAEKIIDMIGKSGTTPPNPETNSSPSGEEEELYPDNTDGTAGDGGTVKTTTTDKDPITEAISAKEKLNITVGG